MCLDCLFDRVVCFFDGLVITCMYVHTHTHYLCVYLPPLPLACLHTLCEQAVSLVLALLA